MLIPSNIMI